MPLIFKKSTAQPAFTVAAAITGTTEATQTLTCAYTVVRARAVNVTVRWYRHTADDGTDPSGVLLGTGSTYALTGTDVDNYIRAIVTAINPAGTVQSTTSYTAIITSGDPPEPPALVTPAVITGTADVGETLTVTYSFSGTITSTTIQWYSYATEPTGSPLAGTDEVTLGTASTQALTESESGRWIVAVVTATNAVGSTVSSDSVAMAGVDPYEPIAPAQYEVPAYDISGLTQIACNAGDDLQAKLNALMPGQCLVLEAGATWSNLGYYVPSTNLDGSDWAYIISSDMASLPAEGTRVSAADAAYMPTISQGTWLSGGVPQPGSTAPAGDGNNARALNIHIGVKKLRIVGLELTSSYVGDNYNRALVHVGNSNWPGYYGEEVVFDRCYIHGSSTPGQRTRDGITMYYGTKKVAVKECLIDYICGAGIESHAIHVYTSYGPVLIHNNTIRSASINVFLCDSLPGSGVTIAATPQDITITKNLIDKRAEWLRDDATWDGYSHDIKCFIESKGSHRVLVEGNVIHRGIYTGQPARPFYVSPDGGTGFSDLDFKNNLIVDAGTFGFANDNDAGRGYGYERCKIANNIYYRPRITNYQFAFGGLSTGFGRYVDISANTFVIANRTPTGLINFGLANPTGVENVKFQDNIVHAGTYGIKGTGIAAGKTSLDYHVDGYSFTNNIVRYTTSAVGNSFNDDGPDYDWNKVANLTAVGFVNTAFTELGHFALAPESAYYTASTTGGPIGADVDAVIAAVNASDIPTLG